VQLQHSEGEDDTNQGLGYNWTDDDEISGADAAPPNLKSLWQWRDYRDEYRNL
jgi:hypothetical protein